MTLVALTEKRRGVQFTSEKKIYEMLKRLKETLKKNKDL
jgi:hypothetical protein